MDSVSDFLVNAMSPSDPESNSTFKTLLGDSLLSFSRGVEDIAVMIPLPFTACRCEVELIFFGLTTLIVTAGKWSTFLYFRLDDLSSLSLDK